MLSALPLAGAYANPGPSDYVAPTLHGPRLAAVLDQAQGVDDGIADARREGTIGVGEARQLEMRADRIAATARQLAAGDHGRLPRASYEQILKRLDHVDDQLRTDDGDFYKSL